MKQVETISINGIVFSINNDAYTKLNIYIDSLSKYFENEQEGKEIIGDIEARISELFTGRQNGSGKVISLDDVQYVIDTLGSIEDITNSDEESDSGFDRRNRLTKRLYRNPNDKRLGGVCSGIAALLGIDTVIVRLVFIIPGIIGIWMWNDEMATLAFSAMAYVILWIIVPLAKTTAQKLEMHGRAINIGNIEKSIKQRSSGVKRTEQHDEPNILIEISGRLFRIIAGVFVCCLGLSTFLSLIGFIVIQDFIPWTTHWVNGERYVTSLDFFSLTEFLSHIFSPLSYKILIACIIIITGLFVAACFYWGAKFILGFRTKYRKPHLILLAIWLLTIPIALSVCISEVKNYKGHNEISEIITLPASDTVRLTSASMMQIFDNPLKIYFDKENNRFYGKPTLSVRTSSDNSFKLEIRKKSQGKDMFEAYRLAEKTDYTVGISNEPLTLSFPSYFTVSPQDQWKFQQVKIYLYVPKNTCIIRDKSFKENHFMYNY